MRWPSCIGGANSYCAIAKGTVMADDVPDLHDLVRLKTGGPEMKVIQVVTDLSQKEDDRLMTRIESSPGKWNGPDTWTRASLVEMVRKGSRMRKGK